MTELLPYRSQRQRLEDTASVGLLVLLAGWTMWFAGALFAYGALRLHAPQWPPTGAPRLSLGVPAAGLLSLAAGSAAMQVGVWRIQRGRSLELSAALILALLFGLLYLGLQLVAWHQLERAGVQLQGEPYGAALFAITGLQAVHAAVVTAAAGALLSASIEGRYSAARHLPIRLWAVAWHFLTAISLAIFGLVFAL